MAPCKEGRQVSYPGTVAGESVQANAWRLGAGTICGDSC